MIGLPEILIILTVVPIQIIPFWRIFQRIGYPPPLSLLTMIPGVTLIFLYLVAFSDWPALRQGAPAPDAH